MADDTVQQVARSSASSAVKSHPTLIQRRPQGRRTNKENKKNEERDEKRKKKRNARDRGEDDRHFRDTVTLTTIEEPGYKEKSGLKSALSSGGSAEKTSAEKIPHEKTIDIRI